MIAVDASLRVLGTVRVPTSRRIPIASPVRPALDGHQGERSKERPLSARN